MKAARKLATVILSATLLLLPGRGSVLADQIKAPALSTGAVTTSSGSFLNVGQAAIGNARSTTHMMRSGLIPAIISFSGQRILGDLDLDGDVDLDDHEILAACLTGPGENTPPRGCTQEQFDLADLHIDRDVDLQDFEIFLEAIITNYPTP